MLATLALLVATARADLPEGDEVAPARVAHGTPPRIVPERWTIPSAVLDAVRAVRAAPIGERMEAASRSFLGLPYLYDAAGEGQGVDPDPPARYDAFDCVTFTEEVLGLALAGDPLGAPQIRNALRYRTDLGGDPYEPTHEARRQFMEAEWIPDAIANGLLTDITDRVGHARVLVKDVVPKMWQAWRHTPLFHVPPSRLPTGRWSLKYLDLAEAAEAADHIPPGAVILTLRIDRPSIPAVITHVSVMVPGDKPGDPPRMRHASHMGTMKVRDDDPRWYAEHLRDYVHWPALGLTVLMPREQGPRISALKPIDLPAEPLDLATGPLPHFDPKPLEPVDATAEASGAANTTAGAGAGAVATGAKHAAAAAAGAKALP